MLQKLHIFLDSFGAKLRVKDGIFLVKPGVLDGIARPAKEYPAHEVEAIWLQQGTSVSADAIMLAQEHLIDLVVTDRYGHPIGRFWGDKPGSTVKILKAQIAAANMPQGMAFVKDWVLTKMRHQLGVVVKIEEKYAGNGLGKITEMRMRMEDDCQSLATYEPEATEAFKVATRSLEARVARSYWKALSLTLPLKYQFASRSFRPSKDVFNALLNYGYGILYQKVERALLVAGINPYIGFMHRDGYNHKAMLFDFIEPYRAMIDRIVYKLCQHTTLVSGMHYKEEAEAVWLTTDGKQLMAKLAHKKLDGYKFKRKGDAPESPSGKGIDAQIRLNAHAFARALLLLESPNSIAHEEKV